MDRKNYYPNMDLVRYLLALAVIVAHVNELAGFDVPFFLSSFEAVGGFFALSGFLMYPNYMRHGSLSGYTRQRARRILPPYIFIIVLAAVALSAVSTLKPGEYFSSGGFWGYLAANITFLNWLHPDLPGVFDEAAYTTPAVNGSLWTMKVEWCLYFSVPVFVWLLGRIRRLRPHWLALTVVVFSIAYRYGLYEAYQSTGREIFQILGRQIFGQLAYFYCGMLICFFKDFFMRHIAVMLLAGVGLIAIGGWIEQWSAAAAFIINPPAISVLVLALSLLPYDIKTLRHKGNVSYEMYLFHYPIIQTGIWLGIGAYGVWAEFSYVLACTVSLSVIAHFALGKIKIGVVGRDRR